MTTQTLRIGTRGSALALWQAEAVGSLLTCAHPDLRARNVIFKTAGDLFLDRPLADLGGKGLFTRELEDALLAGEIDLAVHSLKDVPTSRPEGLVIGAIPKRGDVRDCIVTRALPEGGAPPLPESPGNVGTASLRRACLSLRRWPSARIEPIRGNVQTRLERVLSIEDARRCDVVVLAMAGLLRLELTERKDMDFLPLNPEHRISAVGQGALPIGCRADNFALRDRLKVLHHADSETCVLAERAFLRGVEGDCRVPVGAYATIDRERLRLRAFVGSPDGRDFIDATLFGDEPLALGESMAVSLLGAGGAEILRAVRAARS